MLLSKARSGRRASPAELAIRWCSARNNRMLVTSRGTFHRITPEFCCKATRALLSVRNYDGRFVSSNVRYAGAESGLAKRIAATDRDGRRVPARVGRRTAWWDTKRFYRHLNRLGAGT